MALTAGTRLGACEIGDPLGAGGMGEVYRARDTKLRRAVAIEILPEAFAADPERVARFQWSKPVDATPRTVPCQTKRGVESTKARKLPAPAEKQGGGTREMVSPTRRTDSPKRRTGASTENMDRLDGIVGASSGKAVASSGVVE
jgi:serine/threonine protein kinase